VLNTSQSLLVEGFAPYHATVDLIAIQAVAPEEDPADSVDCYLVSFAKPVQAQ
jgi:hypothetical protein